MFILVLETLLCEVQKYNDIKGMKIKGFTYKYRAFGNDVMFIVENPIDTLPVLLNKIKGFGDLAGFYVNKEKLNMMCKNMSQKKTGGIDGKNWL